MEASSSKGSSRQITLRTETSHSIDSKERELTNVKRRHSSFRGIEDPFLSRKYFKNIKMSKLSKQKEEKTRKRTQLILNFIFYFLSNAINLILIGTYIIENSYPKDSTPGIVPPIEISASIFFSFEFVLHYRNSKSKMKFLLSVTALIDYVTVIPVFLSYFFLKTELELSFLRIFRIFRIFRVLRIYKSFQYLQSEDVSGEGSEYKVDRLHVQIINIFIILASFFFIGSGFVLLLQEWVPHSFSQEMLFIEAFYYFITTCLTIGYGDILPINFYSRMLIILGLFVVVGIVSNQLTKVATLLSRLGPGILKYQKKDHILVVIDESIDLHNLLNELRRSHSEEIVLITKDIEKLPSREYPYNRVFIINVDTIDLDVLERANARFSKHILLFSEKSIVSSKQKEKLVDFILLKFLRLQIKAPISIQSLYSKDNYALNLKSSFKRKVVVPVFRLKSMMLAKASFNPGFLTFAQNLIFNNYDNLIYDESLSEINRNYIFGCENKIYVDKIPEYMENKPYSTVMLEIYMISIANYHQKVYTDSSKLNRPVLVIGLVEQHNKKTNIEIFPTDRVSPLKKGTRLIYIANDRILRNWNKEDGKQLNHTQIKLFHSYLTQLEQEDNYQMRSHVEPRGPSLNSPSPVGNRMVSEIFAKMDKEYEQSKLERKTYGIKRRVTKRSNKNSTTLDNLTLIADFEDNERGINTITSQVKDSCCRRYVCSSKKRVNREDKEYLFEKRIINLEKSSVNFSNHVVVVGVQQNLHTLINMLNVHFRAREICILTNKEDFSKELKKMLKTYNTLYLLKGSPMNPKHLKAARIKETKVVICLSEEEMKGTQLEDSQKLITYRSIDYFFTCDMLIELHKEGSTKFLGNMPIDNHEDLMLNEYMNPNFMAGRVLYLNQMEKIIAQTVGERSLETEIWTELMALGYFTNGIRLKNTEEKDCFPVFVSVDIPIEFHQKEYFTLIISLMKAQSPVLPLGLYSEAPLEDRKEYEMGLVRSLTRKFTSLGDLKIMTSFKKKLAQPRSRQSTFSENKRVDSMKTDFVEWSNNPHPTFITNPQPNYILNKKNKLLCLATHTRQDLMRPENRRFTKFKVRKIEFDLQEALNIQNSFEKVVSQLKDRFESVYEEINREKRTSP